MGFEEFNKFVIGALLHDIGKFKQRAFFSEDIGKSHSIIGYEWLSSHYGEGLISASARNHHANEPETWESNFSLIIYEADNLAASERKQYDPHLDVGISWQKEVLLSCEFCRIRMNQGEKKVITKPMYWPLQPLGGWVEPQEKWKIDNPDSYKSLWEMFLKEFIGMKAKGTHLSINHLLLLLEKYTSFIPSITLQIESATDEESFLKHPDVSLFDHLKITAATASCFYHYLSASYPGRFENEVLKDEITYDWEEHRSKPFVLIGGDLSGIQKFIYTLSSKGALKSLKGRSFFLELLIEYVVDRILEETQLTRCNVIFTGGGHFFILGPNTDPCLESIQKIRNEINDYLLNAFNGDLFQCIEHVPMGKKDFSDSTNLWLTLSEKLNNTKKRKWEEQIDRLIGPPSMPANDCLTQNCEVCGREDQAIVSGEVRMCPFCREQFNFGDKLQKLCREASKHEDRKVCIAIWESPPLPSEGYLSIGAPLHQRFYQPVPLNEALTTKKNLIARYRINDWLPENYDPEDRPLLAGIYHHPFFEELESFIEEGFGLKRAAILRMDVDHLGRIFSEGLSEGERTFSRKSSLSRQLSFFFKFHINGVIDLGKKGGYEKLIRIDSAGRKGDEKWRGRAVSLVYAGGDDLFIIGQWLDCLEAAFDINKAFHQFTGNPEITLSGGLAFGEPHHPIYQFAMDSGDAVTRAKSEGRNSINFLNQTFLWSEAKEVVDLIHQEILPLLTMGSGCLEVPSGSYSKGFLYRLLVLSRDYRKKGVWILPKAAYLAGRNGPSLGWLEKNVSAREAWMALKNRIFKLQSEETVKKLETAIVWILMMLRKGGRQ